MIFLRKFCDYFRCTCGLKCTSETDVLAVGKHQSDDLVEEGGADRCLAFHVEGDDGTIRWKPQTNP